MAVIFNPSVNEENKYIDIMVQPLRDQGYEVHALDGFLSSKKHFQSIRLVHLNWFENVDDSSRRSALRSFLRKMSVLIIIRRSKKKLIWTMHNRASHEKKSGFFSRTITKYLIRWSNVIVIHSEKSRSIISDQYPDAADKLFYLPHPDFIDSYGPIPDQGANPRNTIPLQLLFIGAVKPYKNIEMLIRAVASYKEAVSLTIAGKPNSQAYHDRISELARSAGNINLKLEFIPDDELPRLIQQADVLVLPYNIHSSLNSGTVILAFSYKKTVICPEIGTIEDLREAKMNVLSYLYQSEEEHLQQLKLQISRAVKMKEENPEVFDQLGGQMFDYINEVHNKGLVGRKLSSLYRSLLD